MSTIEPLSRLICINYSEFDKKEIFLLEAEVFSYVCEELIDFFREQYREYFRLMKFDLQKENAVLDDKFVRLIIQDILSTDEYNLKGIAQYSDTPEEVIEEIVLERNTNPSAIFLRRIIDLHKMVRKDLYESIVKKFISKRQLVHT